MDMPPFLMGVEYSGGGFYTGRKIVSLMKKESPSEVADNLVDLLCDCLEGLHEVGRRILLGRLDRFLLDHVDTPHRPNSQEGVGIVAMTEQEAKNFEIQVAPQWQHKGDLIGDIPMTYFDSLCDPNPWLVDVKRYVRSGRAKLRRERE